MAKWLEKYEEKESKEKKNDSKSVVKIPIYSKEIALSSYDPTYCYKVIDFCKSGKSLTAFAASLGVTRSTINKWAERFEDFAYAIEVALSQAQSAWEDIAIDQAKGDNKGNGMTLQFMMKNQFSDEYKDKQEIEHKGGVTIVVDTGFGTVEGEVIRDAEVIEDSSTDDTDLL